MHAPFVPVSKKRFQNVRLMVDGQSNMRESLPSKLTDDHLKNRVIAKRHERLREHDGVGPQPGSNSTGKYHSTLRHCIKIPCNVEGYQGFAANQLSALDPRAGEPRVESPGRPGVFGSCSEAVTLHSRQGEVYSGRSLCGPCCSCSLQLI